MASPPLSYVSAEIETQLLSVMLSAESVREGVALALRSLAPVLDDASAAIAVRGRDFVTIHVLADTGAATRWPARLEPRFAVSGQMGVDPETHTAVIPLRANGSVVGALLVADARLGTALHADPQLTNVLSTLAEVVHVLVARAEDQVRRDALAMRSVEAVIRGMAHQMANPLTGASALAQLLADELTDEAQRATVVQMHHEMKRAFAVLHDLLELQRDTHAQDGVIDLSTFTERVLRFRAYAIREQGIALTVESSAEFLPVRADARWLEHALLLAVRSAELRSQASLNRSIAVRVGPLGEREVAVVVTDSSAGDLPDLSTCYFDLPLQPADLVSRRDTGLPDLGLADGILRACGGRLEARGSKTDGTSLTLVLPRASSPPPTH